MCVVLYYRPIQPSKFSFLAIKKICLVLNATKCEVMDDQCAVMNDIS